MVLQTLQSQQSVSKIDLDFPNWLYYFQFLAFTPVEIPSKGKEGDDVIQNFPQWRLFCSAAYDKIQLIVVARIDFDDFESDRIFWEFLPIRKQKQEKRQNWLKFEFFWKIKTTEDKLDEELQSAGIVKRKNGNGVAFTKFWT